jgi:hypothetical protein
VTVALIGDECRARAAVAGEAVRGASVAAALWTEMRGAVEGADAAAGLSAWLDELDAAPAARSSMRTDAGSPGVRAT